jgi:hypothetical protein
MEMSRLQEFKMKMRQGEILKSISTQGSYEIDETDKGFYY